MLLSNSINLASLSCRLYFPLAFVNLVLVFSYQASLSPRFLSRCRQPGSHLHVFVARPLHVLLSRLHSGPVHRGPVHSGEILMLVHLGVLFVFSVHRTAVSRTAVTRALVLETAVTK